MSPMKGRGCNSHSVHNFVLVLLNFWTMNILIRRESDVLAEVLLDMKY